MSFETSCFSMDHYFLSVFTSRNSNLMFLTRGKVRILVSMVFQRLLNSLNAILTTVLQRKSQKRISRSSACLFTFYRRKNFFAYSWQLNVFYFHFKSAEWPGNFDVCSQEVSLRIISFRCPFWLPHVWNFGRQRVNRM